MRAYTPKKGFTHTANGTAINGKTEDQFGTLLHPEVFLLREMILAVGVRWKKFDLIEVVRVECLLFVPQLLNQSTISTGILVHC